MTRLLPLIPPESSFGAGGLDPGRTYHLVTPAGLAHPVAIQDMPLRTGQHGPSVHRAAFSFFQARTDDGLPGAGETSVKATLAALPGEGHALIRGDLGEAGRATGLATAAEDALGGPVTVLVNNAGIATTPGLAHHPATTDAQAWGHTWERYLRVNTLGTALVTHGVTGRLIELGLPGRVISIGTRGVHRGEPDFPAYAASKAALHSMGASLAVALAPHGIVVATVAPGFVETERVTARLAGPEGDRLRADSPFGRVGRPEEVADAVLWLASPLAQWASGATLDLNGASHLRP